MNTTGDAFPLTLADRDIADARDRIRRYCGLPWSGGPPETWAYRYYDATPTGGPNDVGATDVLATTALHPGLKRSDLAFFYDHRGVLERWLKTIPREASLRDADDDLIARLDELATWDVPVTLGLLSKVLHRKRPEFVPLLDRHIIDWYRPVTGERAAQAAWAPLLRRLRGDLGGKNALSLSMLRVGELEKELANVPSSLRLVDIAIWMEGRA